MTISNYQIYQKPTEHLKTEAEKAWYWAKPVLTWGVLPTCVVFCTFFFLLPADWQSWNAAIFVGLFSVGVLLYFDGSIFHDALFAFVYAANSLIKREGRFILALFCLLISSMMLSVPMILLYWIVMSYFQ